ncbi:MAG: Ig-like domain-containing protein [Spirochaetales bacterium]|nr:Ig-like domain-containing protein [Spirochaetales bacterium]
MKLRNKSRCISTLILFLVSCSFIDLRDLDIQISIPEEGILNKEEAITINFSLPVSDVTVKDRIMIQDFFSETYINTDSKWISDSKIEISPVENLLQGNRYLLSLSGSVTTSSGAQHTVNIMNTFYYVNKSEPVRLLSFSPDNAVTIGVFDSIQFGFTDSINTELFEKEFSLSPTIDISYQWLNDNKNVTILPKEQWDNLSTYSWSISSDAKSSSGQPFYSDYNGVFIVQKDSTPPTLLRIETGNYNESDGSFSTTGSNFALIEYHTALRFVFSEEITETTLESAFSIEPRNNGRLWKDTPQQWIYLPDEGWEQETEYLLKISNDVTDLAGNFITESYKTTFTPAIVPVSIDILTASSTTQGNVNITNFNSSTEIEFKTDLPENSMSLTLQLSSEQYDTYEEQNRFINSITFQGYLPPVTDPVLESYKWLSNNTLILYYSNFISSSTNLPWEHQLYKFSILSDSTNANNEGEYLAEEVSIVFSIIN